MAKSNEEKASSKFIAVMREFGKGALKQSTTGEVVTDRSAALAIAYSKAREIYPFFGRKAYTNYKFDNKHGGKTTIIIRRSEGNEKNVVTGTEKGAKDPKTGFAPILRKISETMTESETEKMETAIKEFDPIIKAF